jgi:hypothetical protein
MKRPISREDAADELFQGKKPDIPFVDPASVKRARREDTSQQGTLL